jgi:SAM-dependent methyltransferase
MAERAREAAPGAEVRVGDAAQLDFPDESFDVVLSSFVVFFMNDPTAALREWGRLLAPDGRLVISTWAGPDPRWAFEREIRQPYVGQADQERIRALVAGLAVLDRFTDHPKVEGELAAAGFADIEVVAHPIEFVFRDEQDWFDLNWSHGARMFLEALPPEAIEGLRSDMRNAMEQVREERGYPRTYTALFARATLA